MSAKEKALSRSKSRPVATTSMKQLTMPRTKRRGQHSIRINDQWRICFAWTKEGPDHVEIVDDH